MSQPTSALSVPHLPPPARAEPRPRLWPGVVVVVVQWLIITVPALLWPATIIHFFSILIGPLVGALLVAVWWMFLSRLRWIDRGLGLLACVLIPVVGFPLYHSTFGSFGLLIYALPVVTTLWVVWLVVSMFFPWPVRRFGLLVVFLVGWGGFTLVRFEGIDGSMGAYFEPRWSLKAEQRFLADLAARQRQSATPAEPLALQPGDWPGFRGPERDGRLTGVRIATDWNERQPREVWRHRVGPGWSSFTVVGTRLFTQEQWDQDEAVICYDVNTGREIWHHLDRARFEEILAGAGPRATPTFHEGKLYTLGAAGRLNCLDAITGDVLWSRDIVADAGAKVPEWGFASSPLVLQGIVTVFAGGPGGKSVIGYNAQSGEPAWTAGDGKLSYCSLHRARLAGVEQVLIATELGLTSFHPTRGDVLWDYRWDVGAQRVVQPALVNDTDVLFGTGFGYGTRRVHVSQDGDAWTAKEVWTTRAIKPYYNDLVVHRGHIYGFDGFMLTCVSLDNGKEKWSTRGYGNGQVLLLVDQDLLLVLSEKGVAALVEANPDRYKELGRFQAIQGKTWNHPVVAHGKLFVRNGEEAACFELQVTGGGK